ncbi:hypothetical protein HWV62_32547 [Athelia sp. TMB]|nr:hypothetical protein HWV62_32547 [Athelia sp. TMB]
MTEANKRIPRCSRQENTWVIEYDAFLGAGDPPADIGLLADLFFDEEKRVFAKTAAGWKQWTPKRDQNKENSICWPQRHSCLSDTFLTHDSTRGVLWATSSGVALNAARDFEHENVSRAIRASKKGWGWRTEVRDEVDDLSDFDGDIPPLEDDMDTLEDKPPAESLLDILRRNCDALVFRTAPALTCSWPAGVETILPAHRLVRTWGCIFGGVSLTTSQDQMAVKYLAERGLDVSDPERPLYPKNMPPGMHAIPVADHIVGILYDARQYSPEKLSLEMLFAPSNFAGRVAEKMGKMNDLVNTLRLCQAQGKYVIIRGWVPPTDCAWDDAAVIAFKDADLRDESAHAGRDSETPQHVTTTLANFLQDGRERHEVCGNLLDSPNTHATFPPFIPPLASCAEALRATENTNNVKLPMCANAAARKRILEYLDSITDERGKRMVAISNDFKKSAKDVHTQSKEAYAARKARCLQDRGNLRGVDEQREVPPMDERKICRRCLVIKLMREEDAKTVGEAQENDDRGKRLYLHDPMISEDQHVHFKKSDYYDGVDDEQHIFQDDFPRRGISHFGWDGFTATRWDLFTHAGFHTWPHHDASGMSTWVVMRTGCKIWCPLIPDLPSKDGLTQNDIFESMRSCLQPIPSTRYQHASKSLVIFALPRDIMNSIQPPNAIHQVYTPINSIASGGHYVSYEGLHLVEIARRPILALARMILFPAEYEPSMFDNEKAGLANWDVSRLELEADHRDAVRIVDRILGHHLLDAKSLGAELFNITPRFQDASDMPIDLDCLAVFDDD